jgi:hypothetical protein
MKQTGTLDICGLLYRVVDAEANEVPQLEDGDEGATVYQALTIYLRGALPPTRKRDARLHEVAHAWLEASGIRDFLKSRVRGEYTAFEETFIRLAVPSLIRLIEANGGALLSEGAENEEGKEK